VIPRKFNQIENEEAYRLPDVTRTNNGEYAYAVQPMIDMRPVHIGVVAFTVTGSMWANQEREPSPQRA
jgi:hypothetical protein